MGRQLIQICEPADYPLHVGAVHLLVSDLPRSLAYHEQRGTEKKNVLPAPSVLSIHMRPP